jgi:hypothetical protein
MQHLSVFLNEFGEGVGEQNSWRPENACFAYAVFAHNDSPLSVEVNGDARPKSPVLFDCEPLDVHKRAYTANCPVTAAAISAARRSFSSAIVRCVAAYRASSFAVSDAIYATIACCSFSGGNGIGSSLMFVPE